MKQILFLLFLLCSISVSAQDVIVKKDGTTILSKVLEVGQSEIRYKKHENLDGPTYTISKSELQAINYQNGAKDTFSEPVREDNRYLPNNQNDGTQQYNDNALLMIDANKHSKKHIYWNIKAGLSFDTYNGSSEDLSLTPGYDVSFGTVFPLKTNNFVLGIDASLFSYGTHIKKTDENLTNIAIGITPYIGYEYLVSEKLSLRPYIGPYVSIVPGDRSIDKASIFYKIDNEVTYGINLGVEAFLSKNFFIDLHCRKDVKANCREKIDQNDGSQRREELTALKIVFGLGYQF